MKRTVYGVALNHASFEPLERSLFHSAPYQHPPRTPVWFIKPRNTWRTSGQPVALAPHASVYSGATLAVVMGRQARRIKAADASSVIAGYCLANELSLAENDFYRPAIQAKCRDGFCPLGEKIIASPQEGLMIITEVNGEERERWSLNTLIRQAPELIEALSEFTTLQPGDVLLLGTPVRSVVLREGDNVTIRATGFPPLITPCIAEAEPILQPDATPTFFALGLNYADHASELAFKAPESPLVFIKGANTVTGENQVSVRPNNVEYMHYEAELVVEIGKVAHKVSRERAMEYVRGYRLCNDYAVRDYLENYYRPNLRVKSRDALTPLSTTLVPKARIADPHNLTLKTYINGEVKQTGNTRDMVFDIPYLIAWLSDFMTLQPGDLIATGTPKGLADVRPGDEVIVEIEGVGRLVNHIVSESGCEES